jgi:uncharacterized protein YgbK (DUF1537 family)
VLKGTLTPAELTDWLLGAGGDHDVPLAYSSADPSTVAKVQEAFGRDRSSSALDEFFAEVARLAVGAGVRRIITAGGETSGAIVEGLGLNTLEIGPEIDPGVPALRSGPELVVALKSGNFGAADFFEKADRVLREDGLDHE